MSKTYFEHLNVPELYSQYPMGAEFLERYTKMSRDELWAFQDCQFRKILKRGWEVPFYQRLWGAEGLEPGDVAGLEDLNKLPVYDKSDLMASIEMHPPFGDFSGCDFGKRDDNRSVIIHTTSGTTGNPQVLTFGPKGREIANLLVARMYQWQGLRDNDVVHSVYGHGTINGGHYIREAVTHFTNALFISAGTGLETPSERQVSLIRDFGATVLVGFVDYLRKLATVSKDQGWDPGDDMKVRMICGHLGMEDRSQVEKAWGGAKAFDWYGVGDTGSIAGEGPERDGLYVWEDAHFLELLDVESKRTVEPGQSGDMVCTCLYKDDIFPIIRFNTHDVSNEIIGNNDSGMVFKRIAGFLGRSDNMIKLRGINFFPHAVGRILEQFEEFEGEYICIAERNSDQRDNLRVLVEIEAESDSEKKSAYEGVLRNELGFSVEVEFLPVLGTAELTQIEHRQKPLRLLDSRFT